MENNEKRDFERERECSGSFGVTYCLDLAVLQEGDFPLELFTFTFTFPFAITNSKAR